MVLEFFDGADEGEVAAGHEGDDAIGEVWREEPFAAEQFDGEGETAGGAAAAEEDPAT